MESSSAADRDDDPSWLDDGFGPVPKRAASAVLATFEAVAKWCKTKQQHDQSKRTLKYCLRSAKSFVARLDDALHCNMGPFKDENVLWRHRGFAALRPNDLKSFTSVDYLGELATEYLRTPWLHNPHLDWVMVDALVATEIARGLEDYLPIKHGFGWIFFDGNRIKVALWRAAAVPLGYAANWLLPGYLCWLAWSSWAWPGWLVGSVAGLYYALNLLLLAWWLLAKLRLLLSREPSPMRKIEAALQDLSAAYSLLGGSVIHVPALRKAIDKVMASSGNLIDQHVLYILDNVEARGEVWGPPASLISMSDAEWAREIRASLRAAQACRAAP